VAPGSLQRFIASQRAVSVSAQLPIIVVGAGTAGCTVVSHLANNTSHPILVVEPGGYGNDDDPQFLNFSDSDLLVTTQDGYVQARAMGGGSAVNGMLLTGDEPDHLRGLTRMARSLDVGTVGHELLARGGRLSRLWWNGGRWNPARAVLHLMEERRVSVQSGTVTKIVHENGVVTGVSCDGELINAKAVVLCAGAISSPGLLLASGLHELNPAIGEGLQNHPTVTAQFAVTAEQVVRFDAAVVREWSTKSGGRVLNVAYERVAKNHSDIGALSVSLMNPVSKGRVELSADGVPIANFRYLEAHEDLVNMGEGVRDLISLLGSGNFTVDPTSISVEGQALVDLLNWDDDELSSWLRQSVKGVSHASSSCAQAVNPLGQLVGIENCWVADASVLPRVPTETPAAPVTMEALRIARNIGETLS
jgi:choline dehydrogenase-like flavoprotein